jgi:ketosteroid isomerase-like protein
MLLLKCSRKKENEVKLLGVFVILAVVGATAIAQQQSDPATEAAIRALEREWTVGQGRNDNRTLDLIFDNRLIYVEYGQLVSKGEYLARVKSEPTAANHVTMESMSVRTFGDTAIVVGNYVEKTSKKGSSVQRWRFVDTWVYEKNGWVLVAAGAAPAAR